MEILFKLLLTEFLLMVVSLLLERFYLIASKDMEGNKKRIAIGVAGFFKLFASLLFYAILFTGTLAAGTWIWGSL